MKRNIGNVDRLVRLSIAIVLFIYAWYAWSVIALLVALFVLYEAIQGWCIAYYFLNKNTCKKG